MTEEEKNKLVWGGDSRGPGLQTLPETNWQAKLNSAVSQFSINSKNMAVSYQDSSTDKHYRERKTLSLLPTQTQKEEKDLTVLTDKDALQYR